MIIIRLFARILGVIFMAVALLQWITFDYPNVIPFWSANIFTPGMFSQFINWMVVCVLGAIGWGLFSYGKRVTKNT